MTELELLARIYLELRIIMVCVVFATASYTLRAHFDSIRVD